MPRRSREAYLWNIADSCRAILEYVQGRSLSDYEQNRMLRRAENYLGFVRLGCIVILLRYL
jgi:uncharacterized protein with HEPN domain